MEEAAVQRQIVEERAAVQKRKRFTPIDWSLIEVPSNETVKAARELARGGRQQQKGDQVLTT